MILRHQLPAWSPLSLTALVAGSFPSREALPRIERRLHSEYGARSVRLTSSGTVALALAFRAAARGERPRVALPAWGCYDLMTAADAVNAEVLLYDLVPDCLAPDPESVARVMAGRPHAIVVAHWFGLPVAISPLMEEAARLGILVVEDAAQAVGAAMGGRVAGALGDFGILSFGRGKGRTGGSGGALLANTTAAASLLSDLAELPRASSLSAYLALWAQWLLGRPALYGIPRSVPALGLGTTRYRSPPPLKAMAARSAAVLDRLWDAAGEEAAARRRHAQRWRELLPDRKDLRLVRLDPKAEPGWLRFPVIATGSAEALLSSHDARVRGVERGYPSPLSMLPVAKGRIRSDTTEFPGARALSRQLFTLPTHGKVEERDFSLSIKLKE
jgi:dTDP-4-amino-4,6-dideoxygalactose transaminase